MPGKNVIDIDKIDLEGDSVLNYDDVFKGIKIIDILTEWNNVKREMGNPPLADPFLLNDPEVPIHFGITINWNVIINLASCPENMEGEDLLKWLKIYPMHHEMGHYFICPFDGITNARLGLAVKKAWDTASMDEVMTVINFFSDIIVNNKVYSFIQEDYFSAMKTWIEHVVVSTLKAGYGISSSFMIFTRVHEMLWKKKFNVFKYPKLIEDMAKKIFHAITYSENWTEGISIVTKTLRDVIIKEQQENTGGTENVLENGDGEESEGSAEDASGSEGESEGKVGGKKILVTVKKDGKYKSKPFDMTILTGNQGEEKTKGSVDELEKENDEENMLSIIEKTGMPFKPSKSMLEFMKVAKDDGDAWRLWLRAKAVGLLDYNAVVRKKRQGKRMLPSSWHWSDPMKNWKVFRSVVSFPRFPFPPHAKGMKPFKGSGGERTLPDVRDILIVRDSSSSTSAAMQEGGEESPIFGSMKKVTTVFNVSSVAAMAALHAASSKGGRFSVINFSTKAISTGWLSPSRENIYKAERVLLQYQGNLTNLPINEMKERLLDTKKCFVLVITDSLVSNWDEFFQEMDSFLDNDHVFSMLFVKLESTPEEKDFVEGLGTREMNINIVNKVGDLIGIALDAINTNYQ